MSDLSKLGLPFLAGTLLGILFFGGLWFTVLKGLTYRHPALWFMIGTPVRLAIALTGFYYVADGRWANLVSCLLGFLVARTAIVRITRHYGKKEGGKS